MTQKQISASIEGFPRPALTVDALIFSVREEKLCLALIRRGIEPFLGSWAIPGGFVRMDEALEEAAAREIEEEIGVSEVFLEQLYTFGEPTRDPRARVVTVAYYALVSSERLVLRADTDAADAQWFCVDELPDLAFDHPKIVAAGLERLRSKIETTNLAYALLPARFRLSDLQKVTEIVLGKSLDKRNFRKRMLDSGLVEPTSKVSGGTGRPAQLFRWTKRQITAI